MSITIPAWNMRVASWVNLCSGQQGHPSMCTWPVLTSLLGDLLQVLLQPVQVLLQLLAAAHVEQLFLVVSKLLLLLAELGSNVVLVLLARRQVFAARSRRDKQQQDYFTFIFSWKRKGSQLPLRINQEVRQPLYWCLSSTYISCLYWYCLLQNVIYNTNI